MTKEDIVAAAFKVWGRDLYRTMSLSEIARELGVSKTALYRHFKDKEALLDAMYTAFFDDCAAFIRESYDRSALADPRTGSLIMMRTFAEYNIRNRDAFIFSLVQVYDRQRKENTGSEFRKRGIDLRRLVYDETGGVPRYPSKFHLIAITLVFNISMFHHYGNKPGELLSDDLVAKTLAQMEDQVLHGLRMDARKVAALSYDELERQAAGMVYQDTEDNALLRAVAGAVAEAGPWNASMEMVAKRSGLSKSGLYAHFKSKQDMLRKLFITEFVRILKFARAQIETTERGEEQLYLAIITIVNYLRSRPEILVAMEWIKTRRLDLGKVGSGRLYRIIRDIRMESIRNHERRSLVRIARWILFMIINTLAWWSIDQEADSASVGPGRHKDWIKNIVEIPNESFHVLFRFIALGLEGLNDE